MNPRDRSVYFSIFMVCFPRPAAPAPKAQAPHLHWVSAGRIDVPQPAAVVSGRRSPADANVGIRFEKLKRGGKNSVVASGKGISYQRGCPKLCPPKSPPSTATPSKA